MSDITVHSSSFQVEDRAWLIGQHGVDMTPGVTLDITKFAPADYPKGFIPSGTPVTKGADGLYGPVTDTPAAGESPAVPGKPDGLLFSSVSAVTPEGQPRTKVGAAIFVHGFVRTAKLPKPLAAEAQAALPLIKFV